VFVFLLAWQAAQAQNIRISYSSRSNSVTPFQVAVVKGLFKEEGLSVEMIQMNPRLGAIATINGDVDFTTTFGSTLRGIIGGLPLKFVAVSMKKSEHFLVTRPDIKDVHGLKGKRLGVSTLFGSDQRAAEEMLRSKGFDLSLLKVLALGGAPVRAEALRSGIVEAASLSSPHDLMLKEQGFNLLAGPQDVKIALPTSGLAASQRYLQEKPKIVKQTLRTLLKANRFVFERRKETIGVMQKWLQQSPEIAERSYELLLISLSRNGEITDSDWENLTEKQRRLDELRDFTLLRQAQVELGIK
jgi:ABC-type nitrate/sulfonate/bicarbonate transport system substrate-binding protein